MREYWQLDFYVNDIKKTRYLFGTEAAANRRFKKYKYENKDLKKMNKSKAEYLKNEKKAHFIEL
jgi:hypothetical protein